MVSIFKLEEIFKGKSSSFLEKEERRLVELYSLNLIHTPNEECFDRITKLASRVFQVPVSLITLVTEDKQWFKSCVGLTGNLLKERSTDRDAAFCQHVVLDGKPLVIENAMEDERFRGNPLVKEHHIRFYAGAPIVTKHNNILGTLCIIDVKPRSFSEDELQTLVDLSKWVHTEIELRADLIEKTMNEQSIRALYEVTSNNGLSFDDKLKRLLKIGCDRFQLSNGNISKITGDEYEIIQTINKTSNGGRAGDVIPLNQTCAGKVVESLEPLHFKQSVVVNNQTSMIKEYVGAPIFVNNHFYGSFCFFSIDQLFRSISNSDLEFLQLMTQWVGFEIERLQNEDLIRKSDKLAAVSQLAASIAHEIRNPLTSVKGFMQLRNDQASPFEELILSELGQMEEFVNEILILANSHLGIKRNRNEVNQLLEEVLLANKDVSRLLNITFHFDSHGKIEIQCDENQIKQVFQHVISNAIESMPNGGKVQIELGMENDESIYILMKDQGVGIAQERIAKLGEPYYSNKEKGSGLGLMISYKIIQNHKGKIFFTSEVGKGTTVKIVLPLKHQV